jgi:hypothetical protein
MSKTKKYALIGLFTILAIVIAYIAYMSFGTYSEGTRAGILDKFSHKGVLFKTWEGELRQGTEERINPQRFLFSVNSAEKEVIADLQKYSGRQVNLHYREKYWVFPWQGESKYFIYKVDLVK